MKTPNDPSRDLGLAMFLAAFLPWGLAMWTFLMTYRGATPKDSATLHGIVAPAIVPLLIGSVYAYRAPSVKGMLKRSVLAHGAAGLWPVIVIGLAAGQSEMAGLFVVVMGPGVLLGAAALGLVAGATGLGVVRLTQRSRARWLEAVVRGDNPDYVVDALSDKDQSAASFLAWRPGDRGLYRANPKQLIARVPAHE